VNVAAPPGHLDVERSVGRVYSAANAPVGCSYAVSRHHMVTCAHVANLALGRDLHDRTHPSRGARFEVEVSAGGARRRFWAEVIAWIPVDGDGDGHWSLVRDVAVLELDGRLPDGTLRARHVQPTRGAQVYVYGPLPPSGSGASMGYLRGTQLGPALPDDVWQVDASGANALAVQQGLSGGPVWDPATGKVVGMVVAGTPDVPVSKPGVLWMIPTTDILAALRIAGVGGTRLRDGWDALRDALRGRMLLLLVAVLVGLVRTIQTAQRVTAGTAVRYGLAAAVVVGIVGVVAAILVDAVAGRVRPGAKPEAHEGHT
jgi:trypsin-like peptidase